MDQVSLEWYRNLLSREKVKKMLVMFAEPIIDPTLSEIEIYF